jgi:hypothetical protein
VTAQVKQNSARRIRFSVEPRDVPPEKAARRLHVTLAEFTVMLPALMDRGFYSLMRRSQMRRSQQFTRFCGYVTATHFYALAVPEIKSAP